MFLEFGFLFRLLFGVRLLILFMLRVFIFGVSFGFRVVLVILFFDESLVLSFLV